MQTLKEDMKPALFFSALFVMTACSKEQARPERKALGDVHFSIQESPDGLFKAPASMRARAEGPPEKAAPQDCISNNFEHKGAFIREIFCEPRPCYMSVQIESNQKDFVPIMRMIAKGYEDSVKQNFPNAYYSESGACRAAGGENKAGEVKLVFCEPTPGSITFRMDTENKRAIKWLWKTRALMVKMLRTSLNQSMPIGFSPFPENDKPLFTSCGPGLKPPEGA